MSRNTRTSRRIGLLVRCVTAVAVIVPAIAAPASEAKFSLNLDSFSWTPNRDVRTKARLAEWNDPMGRMMHHFNQQQAWIMRGAAPGGERVSGVAVRVRAQNGLPLNLLASTMLAGIDTDQQELARLGRRRADDEFNPMTLEEQLSEELGRRLVPR